MPDFDLDQLFSMLSSLRDLVEKQSLDKGKTRYIRDLTPSESEEIASLQAEGLRLHELRGRLNEDFQVLRSRTNLFWHKIKRTFCQRSPAPDVMKINNDNTQLLEVLPAVCKPTMY